MYLCNSLHGRIDVVCGCIDVLRVSRCVCCVVRIPDLVKDGLWGLEAVSSEVNEENHGIIAELAEKNGLQMTGGSDNHGTLKAGSLQHPPTARRFIFYYTVSVGG